MLNQHRGYALFAKTYIDLNASVAKLDDHFINLDFFCFSEWGRMIAPSFGDSVHIIYQNIDTEISRKWIYAFGVVFPPLHNFHPIPSPLRTSISNNSTCSSFELRMDVSHASKKVVPRRQALLPTIQAYCVMFWTHHPVVHDHFHPR